MNTKRFLLYLHAAARALWDDNREMFEGIACEVAHRYGLPNDDVEPVAVAVQERLWEKLLHIGRAARPETVARNAAYQAATEAAIALLPDEQRLRLVEQRRAKRRRKASSAGQNAPNSGTTATSSAND